MPSLNVNNRITLLYALGLGLGLYSLTFACSSKTSTPSLAPDSARGGTSTSSGGTGGNDASAAGATGGSAGTTGGAAGAAGASSGEVGVLGQRCSPPGKLACAGHYQKLQLVCGASGTWQTNGTCSGQQICDTRTGITAGTCQDAAPVCAGHAPGYKYCNGSAVYECNADALVSSLSITCTGACVDGGTCNNDAAPCPTGTDWSSCAKDCGGPKSCVVEKTCQFASSVTIDSIGATWTVRTPDAADACQFCAGPSAWMGLSVIGTPGVKVTVSPPWTLLADLLPCPHPAGQQCLIVPPAALGQISAYTDQLTALPENVLFEGVAQGTTCP